MTDRGERFFFVFGLVLVAIVVSGFSLAIFDRPTGVGEVSPLLYLHGAVTLGWFLLYTTQARLVGIGNLRLHKTLGKSSVLLSLAMVALAYFVVRGAYARPEFSIAGLPPAGSVMFPFTDIANFLIAYGLALANRRSPAAHKRLMLLAGILMIDPAMFRLVYVLYEPGPVIVLLELAMVLSLPLYDIVTRRVPHWASMLGVGLFSAAIACKLFLPHLPAWAAFVDAVFG